MIAFKTIGRVFFNQISKIFVFLDFWRTLMIVPLVFERFRTLSDN